MAYSVSHVRPETPSVAAHRRLESPTRAATLVRRTRPGSAGPGVRAHTRVRGRDNYRACAWAASARHTAWTIHGLSGQSCLPRRGWYPPDLAAQALAEAAVKARDSLVCDGFRVSKLPGPQGGLSRSKAPKLRRTGGCSAVKEWSPPGLSRSKVPKCTAPRRGDMPAWLAKTVSYRGDQKGVIRPVSWAFFAASCAAAGLDSAARRVTSARSAAAGAARPPPREPPPVRRPRPARSNGSTPRRVTGCTGIRGPPPASGPPTRIYKGETAYLPENGQKKAESYQFVIKNVPKR